MAYLAPMRLADATPSGFCNWWDVPSSEPGRLAETFSRQVGKISDEQSWRENAHLRNVSNYLGVSVQSFDELQRQAKLLRNTQDGSPPATFIMQAVRTSVARIAGRQRPECVVQTSGAEYKTRMQSRKLTKFLKGQFHEKQGEYSTIYELGLQLYRDQEVFGEGVAKVMPNAATRKVEVRRKFPWNVFYDQNDAVEGYAQAIYERMCDVDVELLCQSNPEVADRIRTSAHREKGHTMTITVWESYSKPRRAGECGRHVIVAGDCVLLDEEFHRDTFPYVWMIGERAFFGQYGMSNVDFTAQTQERAARLLEEMYENTTLLAGGFLDVEKGAYPGERGKNELTTNERLKVLERVKGFAPAQVTMPQPFSPQTLQLFERMRQLVMETYAVSDFMAQGRKEPGINSGIALRNMNDLQDLNFLPKAIMYENWFARAGEQMLHAVNDLVRRYGAPGVTATLPSGGGFLESIEWKTIKLGEESLYTVTVKPVSSFADEYAARLEMINELQQAGHWDGETAGRVITSMNPDIEAESNRINGQYHWVERIIDEILDADYVPGEDPITYQSPDPFMNLVSALKQMKDAYTEVSGWARPKKERDALMFEKKREAMRAWMKECIELIKRAQSPESPPPGAAPPGPPAPPGIAPPGAPPEAMMPPPGPM